MNLEDFLNLPNTRTYEEKRVYELFFKKIKEYEDHFGYSDINTESVFMTTDEIVENIDRCLKYNRKWRGFIEPIDPEIEKEDVDY